MKVVSGGYVNHERAEKLALQHTEKAVYQAMEAFVYNMNTMRSRSGAQVTFSSVNFGTDTSKWARMISKNLFKAYIAGLGNGENPIFPNLCYRFKKGINSKPGEPNFDITNLALDCIGKRIQPRFVFADSPAYKGMSLDNIGTMGCADGDEVVTYQYRGKTHCEGIKRMWDRLEEDVQINGLSEYIIPNNLKIYDGKNGFVNVKTAVKNPDMGNWVRLTFGGGRSILVTADHPLYTVNRGRIITKELKVGDTVTPYYSMPEVNGNDGLASTDKAYALGLILVDGNYDKCVTVTLDTKTEHDIINGFRNRVGKETGLTEYSRGEKGEYTMVRVLGSQKELCQSLNNLFGGRKKVDRNIPREVFTANKDVRLAFMAGLIDGDGHVSSKNHVQLGSTNKELSLQQLALAQSIGLPAKMYMNHYNNKDKTKLRYRVEFTMTDEIAKYMCSEKKKASQWSGNVSNVTAPESVKVTKIENLGYLNNPSYDVETETDTFTLSFIRSGNCRTAVRGNVNGSADTNARGNLFFNTISLPYVALEAKRRAKEKNTDVMDEFTPYFHEVVSDAIDELLERYDVVKNLKVKDIPFVGQWWQGHEGLNPDDTVEQMVKNGSLSVGFLGLAECLTALTGKHHGESKEAQELGLKIIGYIRHETDAATEKYHLNFATFASPAESACYTLLKKCRNEFGIVDGVTDKEYFTNGNHVPVSCHVNMKQKVDIEAPYHLLCNAGDIFYIEVGRSPKYNKEGLLKLLNYIADSGIVYGGVNWVMDFCNDCHYQGTFSDGKCPKCGSTNFKETKIITGYLSTEDHFNAGKVAESRDRISHAGGDAI